MKRPGPCIISYTGHPGSERIVSLPEMYYFSPPSLLHQARRMDGCPVKSRQAYGYFNCREVLSDRKFWNFNSRYNDFFFFLEIFLFFFMETNRLRELDLRVPRAYGYLIVARFWPENFGILISWDNDFFLGIFLFFFIEWDKWCSIKSSRLIYLIVASLYCLEF